MSARHAYALPFGARLLAGGGTRFRLWAPGQRRVLLEIEGAPAQPLQAQDDGWHELEADCGAGTRYRYRLENGLAVPDPAARAQAGDVHDPSLVVDPHAYAWRHAAWRGRPWREAVIYEQHAGVAGGFDGVAARLPALAALGVTAIELMPVADFPGCRNWGYDGVLPFAPDAAYGAPAQLKALVDTAHGCGLMVLLDVVYNHFGPDGNYLHAYAPAFFREDRQTPWGPAIDFRRPEVRAFFIHNALYWLMEYRFDGLRFDAVHAIDDPGFLEELGTTVRREVQAADPGRQVHLILENEHNDARPLVAAFDAQWNDDAHNALHVLLTGEREGYYAAYADAPARHLARCLAEGFAWQGEPMPGHDGRSRGTPSGQLPPQAFVFFLQNHDQVGNRAWGERLTTLAHPDALRAAVALQLLGPQVPLLFMGEEWGCTTPFLFFTDFAGELGAAVREGRAREFARFAAFAGTGSGRIPDPNAEDTFRRSIPDSVESGHQAAQARAYYRALLRLRHRHLVPHLEGTRSTGAAVLGPRAVRAGWRLGNGAQLTIASNFGAEELHVPLPDHAPLHQSRAIARARGLPARCTLAWLEPPAP